MHSSIKEKITIFTPLSGRKEYWKAYSSYLNELSYPADSINLILLDTSQSESFSNEVKAWIKNAKYKNFRYIRQTVGKAGLADERRVGKDKSTNLELTFLIHKAMCFIYNTMKNVVKTDYVWVIEDDIVPSENALETLLQSVSEEVVSVSGVYRHRYQGDKFVAWDHDDSLFTGGSGIQQIKGNGFGCVLLKMDVVRQHIFVPDERWPDFDRAFYHRLEKDQIVKLDWNVRCEHLSPVFSAEPCPHAYDANIKEHEFNAEDYIRRFPDVVSDLQTGKVRSIFDHYERFGKIEGKIGTPLVPFDEEYYLTLYPDVRKAVERGGYKSGFEHYLSTGKVEGRYSRRLVKEAELELPNDMQLKQRSE